MNTSVQRELIVIIKPDGGYTLDWQRVNKSWDASSVDWQQDWYQGYLIDPDQALHVLGATKK